MILVLFTDGTWLLGTKVNESIVAYNIRPVAGNRWYIQLDDRNGSISYNKECQSYRCFEL